MNSSLRDLLVNALLLDACNHIETICDECNRIETICSELDIAIDTIENEKLNLLEIQGEIAEYLEGN